MNKSQRKEALSWLGENLLNLPGLENAIEKAGRINPFFTDEFCMLSLKSITSWMQEKNLSSWMETIAEETIPETVGLITAGNLPLAGWHDLMSIFASGHHCRFRLSSQDEILPAFLLASLHKEFPASAQYFEKAERLNGVSALIASGSNASTAQFEYYFKGIPQIIRKSRSSIGLIFGFENPHELSPLCDDVMQYFGMGCRSISKILVPENYDFGAFFESLEKYRYLTGHHRYQNNAIYHKAIFLMNGDPFLENDMLVVRENNQLFSPPGVLHYQFYNSMEEAGIIMEQHRKELQCIVSHQGQFPGSIPFGTAQQPAIHDYADGIDTLAFLGGLG